MANVVKRIETRQDDEHFRTSTTWTKGIDAQLKLFHLVSRVLAAQFIL